MLLGGQFAEASARARFRSEAEITAQLQHPNIVAIHEVGEHDHLPFFTMDYVEGRSLAEVARDKPLTPAAAAGYMAIIARAIAYAHERGVLHRDLKPSNILIDGSDQPRITDFGLAKRLTGSTTSLTLSGEALGSPNFMPPEQAAGRHKEIGPASDVYGLGAILYYLVTSRPPFIADNLTRRGASGPGPGTGLAPDVEPGCAERSRDHLPEMPAEGTVKALCDGGRTRR